MLKQTETTQTLVDLLDQHLEEIAAAWAKKISENASFHPGTNWPGILLASTKRGVKATVAAIAAGDYASLNTYLTDLSLACIQIGFESGEAIEALLLCKDAVLPTIRRAYPSDLDVGWAMISELDTCLRWVTRRFSTLYEIEMNRRLGEQHKRLAQMLKTAQEMPEHLELDTMLRYVAEGVITATASDHCDFYLVSEDQSLLTPRVGVGSFPPTAKHRRHFLEQPPDPAKDPFLRHVLEHHQPLICLDTQTDPRVNRDIVGSIGIKSILAVPLMDQNRVFAMAMTGTFSGVRSFTAEQVELALAVTKTAALVVENTRLTEERLAETQSIQRVANALLQELEIDEVLKVICAETQRLTGASGSAIYFLENEEWLKLVFYTGDKPYFERIPAKGSLSELALQEGKSLIANHVASDKRLFQHDPAVTNMLTAPLRTNSNTIGVLYAANKLGDFAEDDARIVGFFADQAAIAIDNARLHEQIRQMAALEERERLAREIHDNMAQSLSVLKLQTSHANDLLQNGQHEQAQAFLGEINKTVTEAHAEARDAIFSLRSRAVSTQEFMATLRTQLERYQNVYGLDVRLAIQDESLASLSPSAVVQLTRIIQEALTNVRKHATARAVCVRLERNDDHLSITVEDDGQGFDLIELKKKECGREGVGLQIMRERADSLGGNLEIVSSPGKGTRVVARIPLSNRS